MAGLAVDDVHLLTVAIISKHLSLGIHQQHLRCADFHGSSSAGAALDPAQTESSTQEPKRHGEQPNSMVSGLGIGNL